MGDFAFSVLFVHILGLDQFLQLAGWRRWRGQWNGKYGTHLRNQNEITK